MEQQILIKIVAIYSFLLSTLASGEIITKTIPENLPEFYVVYEFQQPPVGKVYTFYQANDAQSQRALNWFDISPSGKVTIENSIPYITGTDNSLNTYELTVLLGKPGAETDNVATTLLVKVTDINNFSPIFSSQVYNGTIPEYSPAGVFVEGLGNCRAEDRDTTGIQRYKILTGNDKDYFKVRLAVTDNIFSPGDYSHILTIRGCAAVQGMVFRPSSLEQGV